MLSISLKKVGITARGWHALGTTFGGSGASVPSPPQTSPESALPLAFIDLQSEQPASPAQTAAAAARAASDFWSDDMAASYLPLPPC